MPANARYYVGFDTKPLGKYNFFKTSSKHKRVASFEPNHVAIVERTIYKQIAVFHFKQLDKWYATGNECLHKYQMVLSRGMIGDHQGESKVACPFHKKTFSLETGLTLQGEEYCINVCPVKVEAGFVFVGI